MGTGADVHHEFNPGGFFVLCQLFEACSFHRFGNTVYLIMFSCKKMEVGWELRFLCFFVVAIFLSFYSDAPVLWYFS